MKITINLIQQENEFIAVCPELDINCYGKDKSDAIRRIHSVIDFYIQSAKELGFDVTEFKEMSLADNSYHLENFEKIHYQKNFWGLVN
jgi:predicted RNase H-like HicB family nuclease